jgi:hypothetical protein
MRRPQRFVDDDVAAPVDLDACFVEARASVFGTRPTSPATGAIPSRECAPAVQSTLAAMPWPDFSTDRQVALRRTSMLLFPRSP